MLPLEALCENTSCLVQLIVSFRIHVFLSWQLHHSYFWTIFTLPRPLLSVKSPLCVCKKYNYIHKNILIGVPRRTTTLRSGPKTSNQKKKTGGGRSGTYKWSSKCISKTGHCSATETHEQWREHCALLYPIFIWLSAGTTDPIAQLWTSANVDIQHVDI